MLTWGWGSQEQCLVFSYILKGNHNSPLVSMSILYEEHQLLPLSSCDPHPQENKPEVRPKRVCAFSLAERRDRRPPWELKVPLLKTKAGPCSRSFPPALGCWGCVTNTTDPGELKQQKSFPHSPGGWKSKIKVWAGLVSPKASLLGLLMAVSSLCLHLVFPLNPSAS